MIGFGLMMAVAMATAPDPDQALRASGYKDAAGHGHVVIDVHPDVYLYRNRIAVKSLDGSPLSVRYPVSTPHHDEVFGVVDIYTKRVDLPIQASGHGAGRKGPDSVMVTYQGCANVGICYPPRTVRVELR